MTDPGASRRLRGRTVVVTRAVAQAPELAEALAARGARVVAFPTLEIVAPADPAPLARAARDGSYGLVAFASHNAVERFLAVEGATFGSARLAAVGPKTAAALAGHGPVLVPSPHHAAALLDLIDVTYGAAGLRGLRALVPRAPEGRPELVDGLLARGARVDAPEAYRLARPATAGPIEALDGADVLTFLSGRALENFVDLVPDARARLARATVAVIGPVAARAAEALGVRVDVVPPAATVESLVDALDGP